MTTEWSGSQGGGEKAGVETALDAHQWTALWKRLGRPAPAVDMSKSAAAAVFLGMRPTSGYGVEWLRADDAGAARWREKKPAADAMLLQVITYPWAVKLFPKTQNGLSVEQELR